MPRSPARSKSVALFAKFLLVGVLNSLFGYGCFAALLFSGIHPAPALLSATIVGVLFNFKTTGRLVFRSSNNRLLVRFVSVYAVTYGINLAGLELLLHWGLNAYAAGALLILPIALLAFALNKRLVFVNA